MNLPLEQFVELYLLNYSGEEYYWEKTLVRFNEIIEISQHPSGSAITLKGSEKTYVCQTAYEVWRTLVYGSQQGKPIGSDITDN